MQFLTLSTFLYSSLSLLTCANLLLPTSRIYRPVFFPCVCLLFLPLFLFYFTFILVAFHMTSFLHVSVCNFIYILSFFLFHFFGLFPPTLNIHLSFSFSLSPPFPFFFPCLLFSSLLLSLPPPLPLFLPSFFRHSLV